jgi:hypothetical protein
MEHRLFGRTGLHVLPLALGAMNFGGVTNEADSLRLIHAACAACDALNPPGGAIADFHNTSGWMKTPV